MSLLSTVMQNSVTQETPDLALQNWLAVEDSLNEYGFVVIKSLLNKCKCKSVSAQNRALQATVTYR